MATRDSRARPAADFTLKALDGSEVSLASLRGKVVLVNFWFPGCGPCRAEFPHLQDLYARYKAQGFEVVAIDTTSDDAGAKKFIEQKKITFRSLTGNTGAVAQSYGVTGTPHNAVIDRDGRLYFTSVGFGGDRSIETLRGVIEPLLARRPPAAK